jgi:hypothetical protein
MTTTLTSVAASIRTPFNTKQNRMTPDNRRVFKNGRWQRPDPMGSNVLRWMRGEGASK